MQCSGHDRDLESVLMSSDHIMYIEADDHFPAAKWCEENDMMFMSFPAGSSFGQRPRTGFCFVNADDKLQFALRWA